MIENKTLVGMNESVAVNVAEQDDIAEKETVTIKDTMKILGLKYGKTRKILYNEPSIRCIDYGGKKVFVKEDVYEYKRSRCVNRNTQKG